MKDSRNTAKLLDLPYSPEAEAMLDELERSGQFSVGLEAEADDAASGELGASNDYSWGRGSGKVKIQDWWTTGRVSLRLGPNLTPNDIVLARIGDSLVVRTHDGLDRALFEGYLGLIPDASTLRIVFDDGGVCEGPELIKRIGTWMEQVAPRPEPGN